MAASLITLKLATSLGGCIALANGESRWITGPRARAHAHVERARHEAILVGRGVPVVATWCREHLTRLPPLTARLVPAALMASLPWGLLATHPC